MVDQILQEIERNGFCLIPKALSAIELRAINEFFEISKPNFGPARVGSAVNKQRVETIRGDFTFWINPLDPPIEFLPAIDFLNDLRDGLNKKFYLGLRDFECHLAYYPAGTFYQKHSDRFQSSGTRSLSFVFYLNESWNDDNGGELILYNKDDTVLSQIKPNPGSFICFLSEEFPHEVKSANIERRSFTGWMHTKKIY